MKDEWIEEKLGNICFYWCPIKLWELYTCWPKRFKNKAWKNESILCLSKVKPNAYHFGYDSSNGIFID